MKNEQAGAFFRQTKFWGAIFLLSAISSVAGGAFVTSLQFVTQCSIQLPWLIFFLPVVGIVIHSLYCWDTQRTQPNEWASNDGTIALVQILRGTTKEMRPWLSPLIFIGTLATHLCGGSAGREGTALQMGGGVAAAFAKRFTDPEAKRLLIGCGMAACFAAVFGTPLAAAYFCYEIARKKSSLCRCLPLYILVAYFSDQIGHWIGISHTDFAAHVPDPRASWLSPYWWFAAILLGFSSAKVANVFESATEKTRGFFLKYVRYSYVRPVIGACIIIALYLSLGSGDYLGLGIDPRREGGASIISAFHPHGVSAWSWFAKLVFTAITLGSGFKGGEVTPLFFIGATLGNIIAMITHSPCADFAAAGMVAVFAAASRCPVACLLMGCELFGWQLLPFLALVCLIATRFARQKSVYDSD